MRVQAWLTELMKATLSLCVVADMIVTWRQVDASQLDESVALCELPELMGTAVKVKLLLHTSLCPFIAGQPLTGDSQAAKQCGHRIMGRRERQTYVVLSRTHSKMLGGLL